MPYFLAPRAAVRKLSIVICRQLDQSGERKLVQTQQLGAKTRKRPRVELFVGDGAQPYRIPPGRCRRFSRTPPATHRFPVSHTLRLLVRQASRRRVPRVDGTTTRMRTLPCSWCPGTSAVVLSGNKHTTQPQPPGRRIHTTVQQPSKN